MSDPSQRPAPPPPAGPPPPPSRQRWPDIMIGVLVAALLIGFAFVMMGGQKTPVVTKAPEQEQATPIPASPGVPEEAPNTAAPTPPVQEAPPVEETPPAPAQQEETAPTPATPPAGSQTPPSTPAEPATEESAPAPEQEQPQAPASPPATPQPATPNTPSVAVSAQRVPVRSEYRINLGLFGDRAAANAQTAAVAGLGYTVYPIRVTQGYVAQVGPFANAQDAQRALADIQRVYNNATVFAPNQQVAETPEDRQRAEQARLARERALQQARERELARQQAAQQAQQQPAPSAPEQAAPAQPAPAAPTPSTNSNNTQSQEEAARREREREAALERERQAARERAAAQERERERQAALERERQQGAERAAQSETKPSNPAPSGSVQPSTPAVTQSQRERERELELERERIRQAQQAAPPAPTPAPAATEVQPTPPAAPTPPEPRATRPAPSGPTYLQVGSFAQVESAQNMVSQLRGQGFSPTVNAPPERNVTVLVGPFVGDDLIRAEQKLSSAGLEHFRVR